MPFNEHIRFTEDGEQVRAAVDNRAPRALDDNVRYLRNRIETLGLGQSLIAAGQPLAPEVRVGQPVYFHAGHQRFEQALGSITSDPETGQLVTAASAYVWGLVLARNGAVGELLLAGLADVDLSESVSGDPAAGLYYLSNAVAGQLTATRPPAGVSVLYVAGAGQATNTHRVLLHVRHQDFLESHRHVRFSLVAAPAGTHTPPAPGGTHSITAPDEGQPGWLPADHASFNDQAPEGAKFGYNLAASPLRDLWPPVPINAVLQIWKQPAGGADPLPLLATAPDELVQINQAGIWWMTDCYDQVPWPTQLDTESPGSASESGCPLPIDEVLLQLWLTNSFFFDTRTAVLSLRGAADSGLSFVCPGTTDVRSSGHLEARLDLDLLIQEEGVAGYQVLKGIADNRFLRGPVVESIRSVSPELSVSSEVSPGENDRRVGNVVLTANLDLEGSEFPVDTVRLDGAEEEFFGEIMTLAFPADRAAALRGKIRVPSRLALPEGAQLQLRLTLLGREAGAIPADVFTLTYRIVPRPMAVLTDQQDLPLVDTALALDTGVTLGDDNRYVEAVSEAFDVTAGDQVYFTLTRNAPDAYPSELQLIDRLGILVVP